MDAGELETYRGLGVFGRAREVMHRNDSHALGSVDRAIQENMILLCEDTVSYLYEEYTPTESEYEAGSLPVLERYAAEAVGRSSSIEGSISSIACFTSGLSVDAEGEELEDIKVGGTEVEIVERGSDWCTDLARVGCALLQIVGIPARLVALSDIQKAYTSHMITEAYRGSVWGAVDVHTNIVYRHHDGSPATTWDLKNDTSLVERHNRGESTPYAYPGMFRAVAISNYLIWRWRKYDYTVSRVNDYYRSILEMADKGWPGGLRWLHGEDRV